MMYLPKNLQEEREIYYKCMNDCEFFIENYAVIITDKKKSLFKLYDYQKYVLSEITKNKNVIILKSRQIGMSTLAAAIVAWRILFHPNEDVALISTKANKAKDLLKKVKMVIDNVPPFLSLSKVKDNVFEIVLSNNSRCVSETKSADATRSSTLSFLVIDEAAHIDKKVIEEIWNSAVPTLTTTKGNCLIISTPKGMGGWFYNMWTAAELEENDFVPIRLPWYVHPHRDENWKAGELRKMNGDTRMFAQEYETDFLVSEDTVFDLAFLFDYTKDTIRDPIEILPSDPNNPNVDKSLWIWELPKENETYMIGADVARGDANDFSALHVISTSDLRKVAEYRGKCSTMVFSKMIYSLSKQYNNALITVENTGLGWSVIQDLIEMDANLIYTYKTTTGTTFSLPNRIIGDGGSKSVPGFTMTQHTRIQAIECMYRYIMEGSYKIISKRELSELKTFAYVNGKPQAIDSSCHDDLVLSLAQLLYVYDVYVSSARIKEKAFESIFAMNKKTGRTNILDNDNINLSNQNNFHDVYNRKEKLFKIKIDKYTTYDVRDWFNKRD